MQEEEGVHTHTYIHTHAQTTCWQGVVVARQTAGQSRLP